MGRRLKVLGLTALGAAISTLPACNILRQLTGPSVLAIHRFSVSPASVTAGAQATLSWEVVGAESITIDNGVGKVSSLGSVSVAPSWTSVFTLSAKAGGLNAESKVQVVVVPKAVTPIPTPVLPSPSPSPSSEPSPSPTPQPNPVARAHIGVLYVVCGGTGIPDSLNLTQIPVGCKAHMDLNLKDSRNKPTGPRGQIEWHFSNPNLVEVYADDWSPIVKGLSVGDCNVSVTVDGVRSNGVDLHFY